MRRGIGRYIIGVRPGGTGGLNVSETEGEVRIFGDEFDRIRAASYRVGLSAVLETELRLAKESPIVTGNQFRNRDIGNGADY